MSIDKPTHPPINIEWNESGQPVSLSYDDVYFSKENGLKESRYVFLEGNNLAERINKLKAGDIFRIAETGFGTGLNFLATWQLWDEQITQAAQLEFISIEKFPLRADDIKKALSLWPELDHYLQQLLENYPPQPWQGPHRVEFKSKHGSSLRLSIYFDDVLAAFDEFSSCPISLPKKIRKKSVLGETRPTIDAWFLDGFAPTKNPDMWTPDLFENMALNSVNSTSFATFTAAGHVRRGLQNCGFNCAKRPGFGRKREMLVGEYAPVDNEDQASVSDKQSPLAQSKLATWIFTETHSSDPKKVESAIVIGAGLAGAQLAFALAERGLRVTVLEKNTVGSGASSNFQGAIYSRLSSSDDPLSNFNKYAQVYADNFYQRHSLFDTCGDRSGVLHLCSTEKEAARLKDFSSQFYSSEKFEYLTRDHASTSASIDLKHDALSIKNSGWLHPKSLCTQLLGHKNIQVIEHEGIEQLEQKENTWFAHSTNQSYTADVCIICNARDALAFDQSAHLPIKAIRGQVTHCESNPKLNNLKNVICGEGYLCPSANFNDEKLHSLGATFNLKDESLDVRESDHERNLLGLSDIFADKAIHSETRVSSVFPGNVGFRSTSPDYFPIVGPLPRIEETAERFSRLSKKANAKIDECGAYYSGLYCSLAYGSRGLAYTPLTSTLLADLITGSYLAIPRSLYKHLHPARFAIRALMKNKAYGSELDS